ncbi:hypothetical protein [Massilia sp. Dwa41.01b]|nr:hypothetical protein [Massilia sp. Dwa41.01b]
MDSLLRRAAAEAELLEIGAAYGEALRCAAMPRPRRAASRRRRRPCRIY